MLVGDLPSSMTCVQLEVLHLDYYIPFTVRLRVSHVNETIDNPPNGEVALYLVMFHFGV